MKRTLTLISLSSMLALGFAATAQQNNQQNQTTTQQNQSAGQQNQQLQEISCLARIGTGNQQGGQANNQSGTSATSAQPGMGQGGTGTAGTGTGGTGTGGTAGTGSTGTGTAGTGTTGTGTGTAGTGTAGSGSTGTGTTGSGTTGTGTTGTGTTGTGTGTTGTTGTGTTGTGTTGTGTTGTGNQGNNNLSRVATNDVCFMDKAARSNLFEIQSSQLAQERGSNAAVKSFAQKMIQDHRTATQRLENVARGLGGRLPQQPNTEQQADLQTLRNMRGATFDATYMAMQVAAHQESVALFRQYAEEAQDQNIRQFAAQTLPTLQQHLNQARQAQRQLR